MIFGREGNIGARLDLESTTQMPLPRPDLSVKTPGLFSLKGKICLITGGARGIGLSIAHGFLESSCSGLALTYTTSTSAPQLADELSKQYGVPVRAYQMDVRSKDAIAGTFAQAVKDFDRIDVVVANAGVSFHYDALEMPDEKYREIMGVNLDGVWWTATEAGRLFKKQAAAGHSSKGNFILTGSVSSVLVNIPQKQAAYNASKAAAVHLTKSLAVEWASWGGRANTISPGFIETDSKKILSRDCRLAELIHNSDNSSSR